ncbi:MAG: signal peptidase I [Deltaproteobacteria bacterium]|nr:signal peptidase I [Deltaproteobacteria bacterium]MCB9788281.1 signal peptidase I [Deltaproteobacteria bacterium]
MTPPQPRKAESGASRQAIRRARELQGEALRLVKRKGKVAGKAATAAVEERIAELAATLPSRGKPRADALRVDEATIALDAALEKHFGRFRKGMLREYVEAIAWAIVLALIIRSFIFEAFSIPSGSMLPTLQIGDRLFVNKISYGLYAPFSSHRLIHWGEPERGNIIVFEFDSPGDKHDGDDYIKRVVAVAGDRVRLDDNILYVNGQPVQTRPTAPEEWIATGGVPVGRCPVYDSDQDDPIDPSGTCACVQQEETVGDHRYITQHMASDGGHFAVGGCMNMPDWPLHDGRGRYFGDAASNPAWPDVVIPEGHVFVMGDNRDRSEDGRYWGLVPYDHIKGVAFVIWFARDTSRILNWLI